MSFCAPVSPDPLNARSLGFPKSPPLKILDPPLRNCITWHYIVQMMHGTESDIQVLYDGPEVEIIV